MWSFLHQKKSCCISGLFFSHKRLSGPGQSWSFALILRGEWQHGQGTALHWGTGDVLPQLRVHPRAPLMAPGAEIPPPAPPIPACPIHLLKASSWRGHRPTLWFGSCCPTAHSASFFILRGGHSAGRWMRIFPRVPPSPCWPCWGQSQGCGFASGMVLLGCWWAALLIQIPFLSNWPLIHGIFICLRVRFCKNTSRNPFYSQVEGFPIAMCFLCKCMWWPWSHINPCAHLTCSLVLFFSFFFFLMNQK